MFSEKRNSRSNPENNKEQNRISAGTLITGNIGGKGASRIDCTLEGNLKTPGKVVIGESGFIKGRLDCEHADVEGKVSGKVVVKEILSLRISAVTDGEVAAGKLAIEPGAGFNATCKMDGGVKSIKKKNEKKSA